MRRAGTKPLNALMVSDRLPPRPPVLGDTAADALIRRHRLRDGGANPLEAEPNVGKWPAQSHRQEGVRPGAGSPRLKSRIWTQRGRSCRDNLARFSRNESSYSWESVFLVFPPFKPHILSAGTKTILQKRKLGGKHSSNGMQPRKGPRSSGASPAAPLPTTGSSVPSGRCHDAATRLSCRLHAAAFGVVAEAKAVAYLVGHGSCSANGELRVVLGGRGDGHGWLRRPPPHLPSGPGPCRAHRAHASRAVCKAHAFEGCQAHGVTPESAAPEGRVQRDLAMPGGGAAQWGTRVGMGDTHVSSCVESCGRRTHSPRRHCRKAQSVAFASGMTRLWSRSVHTSRPVSAT